MGKYETPDYEVLMKEDDCEIRKYLHFYIVEYENADDAENNDGFGTLFKYISSDNKDNQKISMTTPVIQEQDQGNQKMAFVVPGKFGKDIPQPNNPNLNIRKFHEGLFAVIRYSGLSNKSKELKMKEKLQSWILENDYKEDSDYMLAFYNGPFTLPMLRRNEIWIRVIKD